MREKGLTVFVYNRQARSDAVRAFKAAGIKVKPGSYLSRENLRQYGEASPTPRYTVYAVTEQQYERFMAALKVIGAPDVEVYYE